VHALYLDLYNRRPRDFKDISFYIGKIFIVYVPSKSCWFYRGTKQSAGRQDKPPEDLGDMAHLAFT